ncbi:hypothetical protein E2C01_048376 [Portunus trituberculatus]|uniref:Uncharacterized protein n=1 Tax=Portunus trituberculatus TaxID=210409 RepID=A0A5B7GA24_PORTR|nr:hypothetical protein [Portunus trituberculatus]
MKAIKRYQNRLRSEGLIKRTKYLSLEKSNTSKNIQGKGNMTSKGLAHSTKHFFRPFLLLGHVPSHSSNSKHQTTI